MFVLITSVPCGSGNIVDSPCIFPLPFSPLQNQGRHESMEWEPWHEVLPSLMADYYACRDIDRKRSIMVDIAIICLLRDIKKSLDKYSLERDELAG